MRTKTPHFAERMLDAAGRLFGGQRFHEVRMEDIAAEADVSKGTLYRYFRDKEEMYLALLSRATQQMMAELQRRVQPDTSAREQLAAVVQAFISFFDAQPHVFDLILRAELRQSQGGSFPWQQVRDTSLRLVMDICRKGKSAGEFDVRHPEVAALMLLGGLRAVVRIGPKPRPKDLAQTIVKGWLEGARTP